MLRDASSRGEEAGSSWEAGKPINLNEFRAEWFEMFMHDRSS